MVKSILNKTSILFLCAFLICGCATLHQEGPKSLNDQSELARVWINESAAVSVEEVYGAGDMVYIKYRAFLKSSDTSRLFYARVDLSPSVENHIDLSKNLAVPIEFISEEQWGQRPSSLDAVKSLPEKYWKEFRIQLAHELTPKEANTAASLRSDEKELLFYYEEDKLKVIDIADKPQELKITKRYTQEDLNLQINQSLEKYLNAQDIKERTILLTMVNEEYSSSPFMFVDLDKQQAVSLKIPYDDREKYRQSLIKKGIKSTDKLILDSYLFGLLTRPVSSTYRLFSWAKDTSYATYEVLNPNTLLTFEKKEIPQAGNEEAMDLVEWEKKLDG